MKTLRKRRLYFILILLTGISLAVGFSLFALRDNINLYYTPSQLIRENVQGSVRLGGLVMKGSVHHQENSLHVTFLLTDFHRKISVSYDGVLPSLFREGQGIVARGHLKREISGACSRDRALGFPNGRAQASLGSPSTRVSTPWGTGHADEIVLGNNLGRLRPSCLKSNGVFFADQILAKHDASYHPPKD